MAIRLSFERVLNFYSDHWKKIYWVLLVSLSVFAVGIFLYCTRYHGVLITGDSVSYIWSARNLAAGNGLGRLDGAGNLRVLPDWPPFYPILLSGFEIIGIDVLEGARYLGAFLFGGNILMLGWILITLTGSMWFSLLGALFVFVSPTMASTSFSAMTEPLYIFLSLVTIIFFYYYEKNGSHRWLAAAGITVSAVFLTRFVGASLLAAGTLVILLNHWRSLTKRIVDAGVFLTISLVPMGIWLLRNYLYSGSLANKNNSFTPVPLKEIQSLYRLLAEICQPVLHLFNIGTGKIIAIGAVVLGVILYTLVFKNRLNQNKMLFSPTLWLAIVYLACYPLLIFYSKIFVDKNVTFFEPRFVAPSLVLVVIILMTLLSWLWNKAVNRSRLLAFGFAAALALFYGSFFSSYSRETLAYMKEVYRLGGGYTPAGYNQTEFYQRLQELPDDQVAFTDNIEKLYLYSGRYSYAFYSTSDETLAQVRERMKEKDGAYFVFFKSDGEWIQTIQEEFPEMELTYQGDGVIFTQTQNR